MALVLSCLWLAVVIWLISRALRQRGVLPALERRPRGQGEDLPRLCVVVPARDERANIGPCLRSLLEQTYPPERLHVVVVDDNSTDGTAEAARAAAAGRDNVSIVQAPPLPEGWKGKVHACCAGVAAAPADAEWLCFIDADMRAAPALLASAVQAASSGGLDLLSLSPQHELGSFAERLIIPCGLYVLAFSQDLAALQAPQGDDATATGQFMLVGREAYDDVGGLAAVREEICEDLEFARLVKRRGHRVLLQDGSGLLRTRMYTGWETLRPGLAKNLSEMLGGPARMSAIAAAALVLAWAAVLLPAADAGACALGSHGACVALVPALLASAAAFGLHIAGALHFGIPVWYGLVFPLGYSGGALVALESLRWRLRGAVRWKGRVYP